ncbi:adenosylcobinamide-GDP ribazoletransferase [Jannaschia ovalis]|uniref:Adenosylcobinamide-GDP ribazoletransferase n=1 Tax=Jannaschia ovalis TaxID=3038773 RepID=A0ABY8LGW3_9RHOB|nr:adenosylcobinamide-GDP ribazoletransferase [Jannaschia sp. GRR-S6-38]WGH79385.1 adenosylcobinamide-GDP ribazoletransferase [Jannaschia sp. GRR-S6-38]
MSLKSDLVSAGMLLTRLPVRGTPTDPAARAAWAWPLAGLAVGLIAGLAGLIVGSLGFAPGVAGGAALIAMILATGALHEDGLADVADGFWGGFDRARRLEIMRDSRIGAYGVIALILSLGLRWLLLAEAAAQGAILGLAVAAAMAGRAAMPVLMRWLPPARADGLSQGAGVPGARGTGIALGLGALALLLHGPAAALLAAALAGAAVLGLGLIARAKIGGQTGDVLGAGQQVAEIAVLAALTAG